MTAQPPAEALHPFVTASTWRRQATGTFATTLDEGWMQGRGAYGGLVAAGVLRSLMDAVGDARRRPRTLDIHFCAPARPGPLHLEVNLERAGASVATWTARGRQEDRVVCVATAAFAFPREGAARARFSRLPPPAAPRPEEVPPVPEDLPLMPAFARFFEYRFCVGAPPYAAGEEARLGGWIRLRAGLGEPPALDAPLVAAFIDAWPPALFSRLDAPRGAASVNFTIDFHAALPRDERGTHVLFSAVSQEGDGGTADEHAALWSEDGTHLASCRQLIAVL